MIDDSLQDVLIINLDNNEIVQKMTVDKIGNTNIKSSEIDYIAAFPKRIVDK